MNTKVLPRFGGAPGVLGLVILAVGIAAQARADKVDDFVLAQMQKQHIPAVSIAVVKHGKVVKARGYGVANLELDTRATPETVYQIGSVSKQFIATGILLLDRDGKLSLDDPVRKYMEDAPEAWRPITIRHLLTHTSGLVRESPVAQISQQTNLEAVRAAYGTPLVFQPGEKMQYSNLGYFTLAEIITRAAGKPWPQFMEERVFKPLGMNATRTTTNEELVAHRAGGYVWADGRFQNAQLVPMVRPSGAFLSTVQDLARWDAALYSDAILAAAQREQMWSPVKLNNGSTQPYGFGWEINRAGQHRLIRHAGAMLGYRSEMSRYVDDGLTVVVLTNLYAAPTERISSGIAALYIDGLQPKRKAAKLSIAELDAFTGRYQLGGGVLTVSRNEDQLVLDMAAGPRTIRMAVLKPMGRSVFFDEDAPRPTYHFEPDAQGRLNFVQRSEEGKEGVRGVKLDPG